MTPRRLLASLTLSLALTSGSAAIAQAPPAEGAEPAGEGRSLDGYFATAVVGGLALFILCKSARRS